MTKDLLTREEPTQEEIDGVARVFEQVENDEIARQSAYIMAKMFKRVFVASVSHTLADSKTPSVDPEKGLAIKIANIILDDARRDPDSTESMLSRQFLRSLEEKHSKTPQGWQLVPKEPTVAMNGAGMEMRASRQAEETLTSITSRQYKAMLAAAPTLCEAPQGKDVEPLDWVAGYPDKPGAYIVGSNIKGRRKEASIGYWDGNVWQHWSGFYDHAITHYMPSDLPERQSNAPTLSAKDNKNEQ